MQAIRRFKFSLMLVAITLAAITSSAWSQRKPHVSVQKEAVVEPRSATARGPLNDSERARIKLFEEAAPSVAYITTEVVKSEGIFTGPPTQGAGTGFLWDTTGNIVTNYHVVEGVRTVAVQFESGDPIPAAVVGTAPEYDLAVVRIARPLDKIKPIPLGSSHDLKVGQTVYAIGNPFGLQRTLTQGIVSALDRELPTSGYREVAGVIQTDAAINPGNSGGPLLDSAGRLIGVTTAIRSNSGNSAGIGFAIPSDLVNRVVPSLIGRGRAPVPGIGILPMPPETVARAGILGVVIQGVQPKTPAAKAKLLPYDFERRKLGDVITAVNNKRVESLSAFGIEIERAGIGSTVNLTVMRDGEERNVEVKVIDLRK
ncbi:MAG TPA: trypsin-like peptidase domain-containing protein [Burkholderiaceae bacterium]|nr:trypsin-like peptidase domain-containing protein [Burkholderiaceae bacterium]